MYLQVKGSNPPGTSGGFDHYFPLKRLPLSDWELLIILSLMYIQGVGYSICFTLLPGGAVAQSVERATPGEEVPGSIPAVAARSLLVGSVSV